MKIQDIVNQLKAVLPRYTNDFSTSLSTTSLTRSGAVATATTSEDHNFSVGDKVLITGAKTPITISSLTRINQTIAGNIKQYALAICATKHNLTKASLQVEISGANQAAYNGTNNLVWTPPVFNIESIEINTSTNVATITTIEDNGFIANSNFEIELSGSAQPAYNRKTTIASIIDSKTFTISDVYGADEDGSPASGKLWQVRQILNAYTFIYEVTGNPTTPATGTITQLYEYQTGYNGYKTIATIPTSTTFTYEILSAVNSPAQGAILTKAFPTITGAISLERAKEFYQTEYEANQSKKWMIVVLGDNQADKTNWNQTDAINRVDSGEQIRMQSFQNAIVYIFLPCGDISDELMYTQTRDLAESYRPHIFKAILGYNPPSNLAEHRYSKLLWAGDGYEDYNGAYYVHQYTFQATNYINYQDAVAPADLSAFREFDFDVYGENEVVMNINGLVDQED